MRWVSPSCSPADGCLFAEGVPAEDSFVPEEDARRSLAEGFAGETSGVGLGPRFLLAFFLLGMTMQGGSVRFAYATDGGSRRASGSDGRIVTRRTPPG